MRLIKPGLFLSAEDYSDWPAMTQSSLDGDGLGFDATWYGDFHHNLDRIQGRQSGAIAPAGRIRRQRTPRHVGLCRSA